MTDRFENCIYRFINKNGEIIYIGKATNLTNRLHSHTHLPKECYDEMFYVEYINFKTKDEMDLAERYYIPKAKPKYNTMMKEREITLFISEFENKEWNKYKKPVVTDIKRKVVDIISGKTYNSIMEASLTEEINYSSIGLCCTNRARRVNGNNGKIFCFMYEEEYLKTNKKEIDEKIFLANNDGIRITKNINKKKQILCITTNETFESFDDISYYYEISKPALRKHLNNKKDSVIGFVNGKCTFLKCVYIQ